MPNYAYHCRNNENLCGKVGFLYEAKEYDDKYPTQNFTPSEKQHTLNTLHELNNRCCGEVNETDEIEQLEKEASITAESTK